MVNFLTLAILLNFSWKISPVYGIIMHNIHIGEGNTE
jgi:hypothetical protein